MDLWSEFFHLLHRGKETPLSRIVSEAMEISRNMSVSSLQDPLRFRARFFALKIANDLVDDAGDLQLEIARVFFDETKKYLIGPRLEDDAFVFEHIHSCLQTLLENEKFRKLFLRLSPPLCHKGVERLIRETLYPKLIKEVKAADVKRAVLAAWMTRLYQTTGSCFATAPAIVIQAEQPLQFLQDILDLLMTGALRRVMNGQQFAVPLNPSRERADLSRPLGESENISLSPGLLAALDTANLGKLHGWIEKEAKTVKELIELILLRAVGLKREDVKEEEGLKRIELSPLLARNTAIYYQKPSERAKKVAEWKEKVELALAAYYSLGDCSLLRAWESTLASFTDAKVDIGRWNLYNSLGMHPDQPGGIGDFLYQRINGRLQKINREIIGLRNEYERALASAKNAERMGQKSEWERSMYTINSIAPQIEELGKRAETLAHLLSKMIGEYDRLIPETFQEIFDPSLTQNVTEMIDDSPAGFRLAYKHGRSASSQWTFIRNGEEFIRSLKDFFEYAERELGLDPLVEELSTELIQYIQTEPFLQGALARAKANPTMQGKIAKPWEYISGGNLTGLLQVYCNRNSPFTTLEGNIQSESELISFLSQCMTQPKRILIQSPTHAFILRPDLFHNDPVSVLEEMADFWREVPLMDEEWLAEKFSLWLTAAERPLFLHRWRQKQGSSDALAFRAVLIECAGIKEAPRVDSFLYESLPLMHKKAALLVAPEISGLDDKYLQSYFADSPFFTPVDFRERLKLAMCKSVLSENDLDLEIAAALRTRKLAAPKPILFADTNWTAGLFGLAISAEKKLDLWRFQRTAMTGVPMRAWFHLQKESPWIALCRPQEYSHG